MCCEEGRHTMASIRFDRLTKRYGAVTAVHDFSATLEPGTITGFLGANGAGKSTTLRMLLGLTRPTSGTATIDGRPYAALAQPARVIGASNTRIIFRHIMPNVLSTLVTFMPFTVVAAISAITALDFLGFGLPAPTPSLGELLKQGTANLRTAPWIVISAFGTLVALLTLVTFIGEAIRESFDPKTFSVYR